MYVELSIIGFVFFLLLFLTTFYNALILFFYIFNNFKELGSLLYNLLTIFTIENTKILIKGLGIRVVRYVCVEQHYLNRENFFKNKIKNLIKPQCYHCFFFLLFHLLFF